MTYSKPKNSVLTDEEYEELVALKNAITYQPSSVSYEKMEKFSELMVRSLEGKFDPPPPKNWRSSPLSE